MVERNHDPRPGSLTFDHGQVPDNDTVPQPPPEPAPPVTFAERLWAALFVGVVLAAIALASVLP